MYETIHSDGSTNAPWPNSSPRVPDTSMLPGSEKAAPAAVGMPKGAVRGAHDAIDRVADRAEPAVRRLGESVASAGDALHAKTDQLRETRDQWIEGARSRVRTNPLSWVAAAFALGTVIARIRR